MADETPALPARRIFMMRGAAIGGLLPLAAAAPPAGAATPLAAARVLPEPLPGYLFLGPQEAAFTEALVDTMCPEDALTPAGTRCGLAVYIDRQLAGDFGAGARRYVAGPWLAGKPEHGLQLPLTPQQHFKAGVELADQACVAQHGKAFSQLAPADADRFLQALAAGHHDGPRLSLATWFDELVYPLFNEACFADPLYGGNIDKVFWKLIGYPGLPATNTLNMVRFRGVPFPGAGDPKSIADFS